MAIITGNTYPVKDALKAIGGTWDKDAKGWKIPEDKVELASAIVAAAGPKVARQQGNQTANCADCGKVTKGYRYCYKCAQNHQEVTNG